MERKNLFKSTIEHIARLWDSEEKPTSIGAEPVNDLEDQVKFIINGNEHQEILSEDSDERKAPNS